MITNIESLRAHVAYHVIPEARRLQSEIHTTSNTADHASKYYALLEKVTLADTYLDNNPSLRRDSRCRCICNELKNSVAL
ncbi:MAG: hypothetical protein KAR79_01510, partial [Simkaniaceae bacterium]|nr:hypothetical protein [Simkaniaceae bacterium]